MYSAFCLVARQICLKEIRRLKHSNIACHTGIGEDAVLGLNGGLIVVRSNGRQKPIIACQMDKLM